MCPFGQKVELGLGEMFTILGFSSISLTSIGKTCEEGSGSRPSAGHVEDLRRHQSNAARMNFSFELRCLYLISCYSCCLFSWFALLVVHHGCHPRRRRATVAASAPEQELFCHTYLILPHERVGWRPCKAINQAQS